MSGGADGITDMDADHGNMDDAQIRFRRYGIRRRQLYRARYGGEIPQTQQMTVRKISIDPNEELVPIDEAPGMSAGDRRGGDRMILELKGYI